MQICIGLVLFILQLIACGEDYYAILGVDKDADDKTIRRAFKKLAISKHPDKNPGNKEAHSEFVTINKAYEVLKDEELRKKYDQYGEEGLSDNFQGGQQYQSWQFYNDNFGIYDEDAEITTLSRANFQKNVMDSGEIWFVNFYSTFCSHCHQLAPAWRKFAQEMEGVIRVGAVNCAEDPMLCQSQRVMGYPSLVLYPQGIFYNGVRDTELFVEFVMKYAKAEVLHLTTDNFQALTEDWPDYAAKPWIVDFCDDTDRCLTPTNRRKLAAMMAGVINVASVNCIHGEKDRALCEELDRTEGVVFYPAGHLENQHEKDLTSLDPREIMAAALSAIAGLQKVPKEEVDLLFDDEKGANERMLVLFVAKKEDLEDHLSWKRLPSLLEVRVGYADCSQLGGICAQHFDESKLPTALLFKPRLGYDINYGSSTSHRDVVAFVKESGDTPLIVLSADTHAQAIESGDLWLIDYFAPWCPPCMRLMAELRRVHAAESDGTISRLRLGTLDCTRHKAICSTAGVASYPTSILYNEHKSFRSVGFHSIEGIMDFVENSLHPAVVELTPEEFASRVEGRGEGEVWVIDFFAPWCGPCQQLAPEFQRVARGFSNEGEEKLWFGTVDCQAHAAFCGQQGVRSYPTIRAFPASSRIHDYPPNMWRNADSISRWVYTLLPSLVHSLGNDFWTEVLDSADPWLVDFFAPWCGHCVQFAPYFEQIAKAFDGRVKLAKIDCDQWPGVCQGAGVRAYPTIRFYSGSRGARQEVLGLAIQSHHRDQIIAVVESQLAQRQQLLRDEL